MYDIIIAGGFIIFMHRDNFKKARNKQEIPVKEFFRRQFAKKK